MQNYATVFDTISKMILLLTCDYHCKGESKSFLQISAITSFPKWTLFHIHNAVIHVAKSHNMYMTKTSLTALILNIRVCDNMKYTASK